MKGEMLMMRQEHAKICSAFMKFKKLDISDILTDISFGEYGLMKVIEKCGKDNGKNCAEISQAARMMEISVPAVSRCIRKLEGEGLAERCVNKDDRRYTFVSVTEKGRALTAECDEKLSTLMDRVLDRIGDENTDKLIEYLEIFQSAVADEIRTMKREEES